MKKTPVSSAGRRPVARVVPDRIYRGRIIEALRRNDQERHLRTETLGRAIHPHYGRNHRQWLDSLLTGLERDGLIRRSRSGKWNTRRISLA